MAIEITEVDGGNTQFRLANGSVFLVPNYDGEAGEPQAYFSASLEVLDELVVKTAEAKSRVDLSDIGKMQFLRPVEEEAISIVSRSWTALSNLESHFAKRETEMFAVPKLDPTHSAAAIEDREIRDWWRSLAVSDRSAMMQRVNDEPGHERLMIALLRAPTPLALLDHETKFMRGIWQRTARLNNPSEAFAIENGRHSIEWGRRGLMIVGAQVKLAAKMDENHILRTLLTSPNDHARNGFAAFGIGELTATKMKKMLDIGSGKKAA